MMRFATLILLYLLLAVWIYLVWMVWRKRSGLFRGRMEPGPAEKHYRLLKVLLLTAGIALVAGAATPGLYAAIGDPSATEEPAFVFFTVLASAPVFLVATIGGLVVYLKGRRKTT